MTNFNLPHMPDAALLWQQHDAVAIHVPQEALPNDDHTRKHLFDGYNDDLAKRIQWMIHVHNTRTTSMLEPYQPSAPQRPGKYEIRILREDGSFALHIYCTVYAMAKFLEIVLDGRDFDWINKSTIVCENIKIKSKYLTRYLTYKYTDEEAVWLLPFPDCYYARAIGHNEAYTDAVEQLTQRGLYNTASNIKPGAHAGAVRSSAADKRQSKRSTKADVTKRKRAKSDITTLGIPELSTELGIPASKVRALLRRKVDKPQEGWVWSQEGFEEILKKLR